MVLVGQAVMVVAAIVMVLMASLAIGLYRQLGALLEARTINERRCYVHETGAEAYSFAESLNPGSSQAEKLERAIDYMRRQFLQRRIPFDYEQARAVIEKAAFQTTQHDERQSDGGALTNRYDYAR